MNFTGNNIQFLSLYWNHLKSITKQIENELPVLDERDLKIEKKSKNFAIISYKDLNDWDITGLINNQSHALIALADKIVHMIYKGDAINVEPMLRRICFNGTKKLKQPDRSLGHGHFRWNYKAYVLKRHEIERLINYFNL